jgi:hypothetical protein
MIIELMVYTTVISLLLGLAALAIERALALAAWPRRWLWTAALVISLAGSAAMSLGTRASPEGPPATLPAAATIAAAQALPPPLLPELPGPRQSRTAAVPAWPWLETSAKRSWLASSILLLGLYLIGALRLFRARRKWPRQRIGKYSVFVTENVGPAVFGPLRPAIVVPRWLLEQPVARRDAALLHEAQHIAAHDPALLLAALLLLALTPWNLPLWWQLRRLRLAIEVDCDARVLRTGVERRDYLDTLLYLNQSGGKMPVGAVAIVGRTSQLEQRVRAMTLKSPRHLGLWMAGWAAAAIPLLVVAAQLNPPPPAPAAPHAHLGIAVADFDVNGLATSLTHLEHRGALITYVHPGDVADQAGVKLGDVVIRFGATQIGGANALVAAVAHTAADAKIPLVIHRGTADFELVADFSRALPPHPPLGGELQDMSDLDSLRDANMALSQPQLRDELIRMARLDAMKPPIAVKQLLAQPNTSFIVSGPHVDPGESAANVQRLKQIIAQYGWPTVSMVGVRGATAAAMIASGANNDPRFQAQVLALMEPLLGRDEVPSLYYAGLFDAVHTPQRFGMLTDCRQGRLVPTKPIEDPQHLEQRRAALGLVKQPQFCVWMLDAKRGADHPATPAPQ